MARVTLIALLTAGMLASPLLAGTKGLSCKLKNASRNEWKLVMVSMDNGTRGKLIVSKMVGKATELPRTLDTVNGTLVLEAGATYDVDFISDAMATAASTAKFSGSLGFRDTDKNLVTLVFEQTTDTTKATAGSMQVGGCKGVDGAAMADKNPGKILIISRPPANSDLWRVVVKADTIASSN